MEAAGPIVNGWAVLVAAVWHMVLGAVWYGPLFGTQWATLAKIDTKDGSGAARALIIQFIAALLFAWVMAHSIKAFEDAYGFAGVSAGFPERYGSGWGSLPPTA